MGKHRQPTPRALAAHAILLQLDNPSHWTGADVTPTRKTHGFLVAQLSMRFQYFDALLESVGIEPFRTKHLLEPFGSLPGAISALSERGLITIDDDIVYLTRAGGDWLANYPNGEPRL